jgi:hypothetical protein
MSRTKPTKITALWQTVTDQSAGVFLFANRKKTGRAFFWRPSCGNSPTPNRCFGASLSIHNLYGKRDPTVSVIKGAATRNDFVKPFRSTQSGINNVSHKIFQISPTNTNRLLSNCKFEPVSRWAFDLLMYHYKENKSDAAADFYFALSGMLEAATLQGHLFEWQVLRHLFGTKFYH